MSDDVQLPDEVDESEREAWEVYVANVGAEYADGDGFRDAYAGEYSSVAAYAEEVTRECYDIPSWVDSYIDWEYMARDWELSGDIWTERAGGNYTVYVFRGI